MTTEGGLKCTETCGAEGRNKSVAIGGYGKRESNEWPATDKACAAMVLQVGSAEVVGCMAWEGLQRVGKRTD